MSIAIMAGVLEARGHNVTVIDPVEKLLAVGHYLESTVDIAESTRRAPGLMNWVTVSLSGVVTDR